MLHSNLHLDDLDTRAEITVSENDEQPDPYVIVSMKAWKKLDPDSSVMTGQTLTFMRPEQAIDLRDAIAAELGGATELALGEFVMEDCLDAIQQQDAERIGRGILDWLASQKAVIDSADKTGSRA